MDTINQPQTDDWSKFSIPVRLDPANARKGAGIFSNQSVVRPCWLTMAELVDLS